MTPPAGQAWVLGLGRAGGRGGTGPGTRDVPRYLQRRQIAVLERYLERYLGRGAGGIELEQYPNRASCRGTRGQIRPEMRPAGIPGSVRWASSQRACSAL